VGVAPEMEVRVNGLAAGRDQQLAAGDQVVVVPKIRGGC
jgi:molybdopterin converting factor small subunit